MPHSLHFLVVIAPADLRAQPPAQCQKQFAATATDLAEIIYRDGESAANVKLSRSAGWRKPGRCNSV